MHTGWVSEKQPDDVQDRREKLRVILEEFIEYISETFVRKNQN